MNHKERLALALTNIKTLPDGHFDALLEQQGLSTSRTFGGVIIAERTTVINEGDSYNVALDLSRIELMVYNAKRHMLLGQFVNGDHFEITFDAPLPAETITAIFQRWQSVHENI